MFKINDLQSRFHLADPIPAELRRSYNISPTQIAPVITARDGKPTLEFMKWGFIPQGAKDANSVFRYKTFNVRSEGIFTKDSSNKSIRGSRCLVPANGYYEWRTAGAGKTPYYIHAPGQELFAFAGIYSSWTDPAGREWGTYSIITNESNKDVNKIHDRMPIILKPDEEAKWLEPTETISPLYELMQPSPEGVLVATPVGTDINSTKINNPKLIAPRSF